MSNKTLTLVHEFVWGTIMQVHEVGDDYAIIEYLPNRPSNAKDDCDGGERFHPYITLSDGEWHDSNHSYHTLDHALVAAIAWKYEDREDEKENYSSVAANSQAAKYFLRMIGAER